MLPAGKRRLPNTADLCAKQQLSEKKLFEFAGIKTQRVALPEYKDALPERYSSGSGGGAGRVTPISSADGTNLVPSRVRPGNVGAGKRTAFTIEQAFRMAGAKHNRAPIRICPADYAAVRMFALTNPARSVTVTS